MHNHEKALEVFRKGTVIPATPLALTADKKLDEQTQRLLMRYYLSSGVGAIATAVHSTQFAIRKVGLFEPVISLVSQEISSYEEKAHRPVMKICGACGPIEQAVKEAETAKRLGYDAMLLSPGGLSDRSENYLVERTKAVAEVLPVIGFYLQVSVGGRILSYDYWSRIAEIDSLIGIKCASFSRYTTFDVMRAVASSSRCGQITMYTGNDDNIIGDLLSEFVIMTSKGPVTKRFEGGLLGHWCIWTAKAVELLEKVKAARASKDFSELLALGPQITDMNAAAFDPLHGFAGCICGIHEVLRRQGLMKSIRTLDDAEQLSARQAEEITRVSKSYPHLVDDDFIASHIAEWKDQA